MKPKGDDARLDIPKKLLLAGMRGISQCDAFTTGHQNAESRLTPGPAQRAHWLVT